MPTSSNGTGLFVKEAFPSFWITEKDTNLWAAVVQSWVLLASVSLLGSPRELFHEATSVFLDSFPEGMKHSSPPTLSRLFLEAFESKTKYPAINGKLEFSIHLDFWQVGWCCRGMCVPFQNACF